MRCDLCNKPTRCSCKWGWCPWCNSTNKQISLMNDLIKFWLSKDIVKERLKEIHSYTDKVEPFTLYEYITGEISEEKFNEALENYKPTYGWYHPSIYSSKATSNWVNPNKQCVYKKPWVWERCIYCNSIKKYMIWKECPMAKKDEENTGSTAVENNESDV